MKEYFVKVINHDRGGSSREEHKIAGKDVLDAATNFFDRRGRFTVFHAAAPQLYWFAVEEEEATFIFAVSPQALMEAESRVEKA